MIVCGLIMSFFWSIVFIFLFSILVVKENWSFHQNFIYVPVKVQGVKLIMHWFPFIKNEIGFEKQKAQWLDDLSHLAIEQEIRFNGWMLKGPPLIPRVYSISVL